MTSDKQLSRVRNVVNQPTARLRTWPFVGETRPNSRIGSGVITWAMPAAWIGDGLGWWMMEAAVRSKHAWRLSFPGDLRRVMQQRLHERFFGASCRS